MTILRMCSQLKNMALVFGVLLFLNSFSICQSGQDKKLEDSIATLRDIRMTDMSDAQKETKAKLIDESWAYLIGKGSDGSARIKEEIQRIDSQKESDDFFKLNAAVVLWKIGKLNEAEYVASIWKSVPIATQYNYVFYTAFEAAQMQDPKALPMLRATLKDDKGSIYVGSHAMRVAWPLSHEFIWGTYGPKGIPVLQELLNTSTESIEIRSAMLLLTQAHHLPSLAKIRDLAKDRDDQIRLTAIRCLGKFGHPNDYEFLIAGLSSSKPDEAFSSAFALYEFEDERAIPHLISGLKNTNDQVKLEIMLALLHLLTPESLVAVKEEAARIKNPEFKKFIERSITLRQEKLPVGYATKSRNEQAEILIKIRNDKLLDNPTDKKATPGQIHAAIEDWKQKGRIYNSSYDWVGVKQIVETGTPADIISILETKAIFYRRLSDECLYETADLDMAIKYLGRSRYRKGWGITAKAELK